MSAHEKISASRANRHAAPLLALIAAFTIIAAGCAVSSNTALPELPPAPSRSTGTFTIATPLPACPAGSTATNPGASLCAIASGTGTIDVMNDAFLGSTYTATISTRGGVLPVTSCQIQGTLPAGVTLNAAPGASGTCVVTGQFPTAITGVTIPPGGFVTLTLVVRATDSGNPAASDTQDIVIRIFAGFSFQTTAIEDGTQGRAFNKAITSNLGGGIGVPPMTSCTATGLPTGLSVAPSGTSCVISGNPSVNGAFTVTVTGTDSAANTRSSIAYPLTINAPLVVAAPTFTNGTVGRPYTITAASTATRTGGEMPLTACTATGLPPGLTVARNAANTACEISGTPTTAGTFNAVIISATDTATPTTAAGTSAAPATSITINPVLAVPAFVIGNGTQGRAFNLSVPSTGGNQPLSACSATGLSAGLSIAIDSGNTSNCLISGTPTVNGAFNVVVTATDTLTANTAAGSANSASTPLTVNAPLAIPAFTFQTGAEGVAYSKTIPTSGGERPLTSCNATGLAAGLAIALDPANTATNVNNCIVSGTPNVGSAGNFVVVVTVNDSASTTTAAGNAASANTNLTINGPLAIPPFVLGNGTESRAFQQDIPVTGGIQPLTNCTISAGALPAGLSIAVSPVPGNCRISGTPGAGTGTTANFNITVQATDTGAPPGTPPATATSANTPLFINAPLVISTAANTLLDGVVGRAWTLPLANTGGQTAFAWSTVGGGAGTLNAADAQCAGLSISAAGVISGTPTAFGVCSFTAQVDDTATTSTAAGSANQAYLLTIRQEFSVTQAAVVDAVEARTYGLAPLIQPFTTNVLPVAGASDFGQNAEIGNGPLVTCVVSSVVLSGGTPSAPLTPANFAAIVDPVTPSQCRLQSNGAFPLNSAGTYRVTMDATDNPIAAVGVPAATRSGSVVLIVQPALVLSDNFLGTAATGNFPDAVQGRSYGNAPTGCNPGPACAPIVFTASGGIPPYVFNAPVTPTIMSFTSAATTLTVFSANITSAPGAFPGTWTLQDAGNAAVPGGAAFTVSVDRTINVNANITQVANLPSPPHGVQGRPYGGAGFTPLTYTASGGLGNYIFDPVPSAPAPGPNNLPTPMACNAAANVLTCNSNAALTGGPGAYSFIINVQDTGNQTTPSQLAGSIIPNLTVQAPLTLTPGGVAIAGALPDAVEGRAWGQGAGCSGGACVPATYTATGGLGATTAYVYATPSPFPGGFVCALSMTTITNDTLTCSSAAVASGGPFPLATTPTVTLDDMANATTPSGAASATAPAPSTHTLTVQAAMTLTSNVGTQVGLNLTAPTAVEGRNYGEDAAGCNPGPACTPLVLTAGGGLPPYLRSGVPGNGPPTSLNCNNLGANAISCGTDPGSAGGVGPVGAFAPAAWTFTLTAQDTANASTPSENAGAGLTLNITMPVNDPISHTTAPSSPLPDARQNSPYGTGAGCSGGACVPVTFTYNPASGLGTFVFTANSGFPAGISCNLVANVLTCSSPSVTDPAGPYSPRVVVNDVANATTTDHATANSNLGYEVIENMTVFAPMNIPALPAGTFDGTSGRLFNQQIPFTGGFGPLVAGSCTATGLPTVNLAASYGGVNCQITGTPLAADVAASPITVNVTVTDANNTTTPNASASTGPMIFNVNDVLTITTTTLPGGATTIPYPTVVGSATLATTGGEAPIAFQIIAGDFGPPVGNIQSGAGTCAGITFDTTTGAFGGTPTSSGICGTGGAGTFTVQATDTLTTSTPAGLFNRNLSITIAAPVALAAWAGGPEDAATEGRPVGGGTGGQIDYLITNGIGPFTCAIALGAPGGTGLSAVFTAVPANACRLTGSPSAADTAASQLQLQIEVTDTNTGLTAAVTTAPFDVFPPLSINNSTATGGQTYPAGVENRAYLFAVPTGGGNQNGVVVLSEVGANLNAGNCLGIQLLAGALDGTPSASGPVTCTFDLRVDDVATRMAATGSLTQANSSIQVNAPLTLTPAAGTLINGVVTLAYNNGSPITFTATGGLGGYTFFDPTDAPGVGCSPTGNFPPGLTFPPNSTATTANLAGTPTTANDNATPNYTFEICVEDTGNAATNSGAATNGNYVTVVVEPIGVAVGTTGDTLEVFWYAPFAGNVIGPVGGGSSVDIDALVGAGTHNPHSVAFTPNVTEAWVTLEGSDQIAILNTVDGTLITTIDLTAGTFAAAANQCTAPRGIVHGFAGTSANRTYVACSGNDRIVVINTSARTFVAIDGTSNGQVADLVITPDGSRVYATMGNPGEGVPNDLNFLDTSTNVVDTATIQNIVTTDLNGGIAMAPDGTRVFVGDGTNDEVARILVPGGTTSTVFALAATAEPRALAYDPTGARVYATLFGPNSFDVRDGTSGAAVVTANVHSASIATTARAANVVTVTTTNEHGLTTGQNVDVTGVTPASFDAANVTITVTGPTTFTYAQTAANAAGTGGTVVARTTDPYGITIPPSDGTVRVFTVLTGLGQIVVHDESATPTRTSPNTPSVIGSNPFTLTGGVGPTRVFTIPRPR